MFDSETTQEGMPAMLVEGPPPALAARVFASTSRVRAYRNVAFRARMLARLAIVRNLKSAAVEMSERRRKATIAIATVENAALYFDPWFRP